MKNHRPLIAAAALAAALGACRTTKTEEKSVPATVSGGDFELEKSEERDLYLQMVATEMAAGATVVKDQLHSAKGAVECTKDGILETCYIRVRLPDNSLSASQLVPRELGDRVAAHARRVRPDLAAERRVLSDVVCDYIGKKSPPYEVEDASCKLSFPRAPNEVIFADRIAEDLADALRGDVGFEGPKMALNGILSCIPKLAGRLGSCLVRAVVKGSLQEKVKELPQRSATPISKRLLQTLADLQAQSEPNTSFTEPSEIVTTLICEVDNWTFACRAKI
jgi:hypothetical protein